LLSLGDLGGRALRACRLRAPVLGIVEGPADDQAACPPRPRDPGLGGRDPGGIPSVLLLFTVCRSLAEPPHVRDARTHHQHEAIRGEPAGGGAGGRAPAGAAWNRPSGMSMRIAFFAPLLTTGGTQRHLQQVLALLDPARFRPQVYTLRPGGEVEDELRAAGVQVSSLGVGPHLSSPRSVRAILRAARALRRERVDVV